MSPPYVPMAPAPRAADPHLPDSPPPSIPSPPPDAPEAVVPPWPAIPEPMCTRLWSAQGPADSALQMPLRETQGLQHFATDGILHEGGPKLEGFAGKNATELLEIANKVFVNRNQTARREAEKRMKQKVALLAAALSKPCPTPPRRGTTPQGKGPRSERERSPQP
ncbi:hypothetical protein E5288_WYG003581 [Bos mutus]|uniref:Uncharacterized protein n=1 Tax=Bos mutus TaxID=72004 RepID=A0A6B0S1I8_9CETA|nr:hypothetical protein [Bos mutus]